MRTDAASWRTSSEAELKEQVELATNVAQYLRRNLAQIRRVDGTEDVWRTPGQLFYVSAVAHDYSLVTGLQLNEHHEIGDNSTIKSPPPVVVPPKGRRARAGQSCVTCRRLSSCCSRIANGQTALALLHELVFSSAVSARYRVIPTPGWSLTCALRSLVTVASPNASSFTSETLGVIRPARYYATGRTGNQVKVDEAAAADDSRSDESAVSQSDDSDIVEGEGSTLSLEDTSKPVFYSQLKKLAKQRVVPTLNEDDLEEVFVRGQTFFLRHTRCSLLMHCSRQVTGPADSRSTRQTTTCRSSTDLPVSGSCVRRLVRSN
jgi:hypothetical protein